MMHEMMSGGRYVLLSGGSRLYHGTVTVAPFTSNIASRTSRLSEKSYRCLTRIVRWQWLPVPSLAPPNSLTRNGMPPSINTAVFPVPNANISTTRRYNSSLTAESNSFSDNWEDWFGVEYENPWLGFQPLGDQILDKSTRYLIEQLQDLYHGILDNLDRPTTEQCNKLLNDMLGGSDNDLPKEQYAFRADAILQCMELFLDIDPQVKLLPYPLPHPNRNTYIYVMTLYSKCKHLTAEKGPLRLQAIVNRMKKRSIQMGDLNLMPMPFDWNKVLMSWAVCVDPEKAFHAANLLQQLKRDGLADNSSYSHVLRTCAFSKFDGDVRPQKLGAQVAMKVFGDMVQNNVKCTPPTYSFFLRACSYIVNDKQREHEVELAFRKCCSEGNVDDTVVQGLKLVASPHLWTKLIGANRESVKAADLPSEWTENATK